MTPEDTLAFELLQDLTNSSDSAPSDFYLFPKLKLYLPGRQFGNNPCCRGCFEGSGCKCLRGLQCMNIAETSVLMLRWTKKKQ